MNRPSPIPTTPSRRGFLTVLSAGAASAIVPAALAAPSAPVTETALSGLPAAVPALPSPDAELFKLLDEHRSAVIEQQRLYKIFEKIEDQWLQQSRKRQKPIPEVLRRRPEDSVLELPDMSAHGGFYQHQHGVDGLRDKTWILSSITGNIRDGGEQIFRARMVTPSPAARARADEIVSAFDKWQKESEAKPRGYRAAKRAHEAHETQMLALERKICKTRAYSLAGIIAKAQKGRELDDDERFTKALVVDLLALGKEKGAVMTRSTHMVGPQMARALV
jgi:hypothetical protein